WKMGNLAPGWNRHAYDPRAGRDLPRDRLVAGWAIVVRRPPPAAREDGDRLSSEYGYSEIGVIENLRRRFADGSLERWRNVSVGRRGRLCLSLRADALAGVCGAGHEVSRLDEESESGGIVRQPFTFGTDHTKLHPR